MKQKLPKYINCKNKEIEFCEYYMHESCPETCGYAWEIRGIGIGAMDEGIVKLVKNDIRKEIK